MSMKKKIEAFSSEFGITEDLLSAIIAASPEEKAKIESLLQAPSDNGFTYAPTSQGIPFPVSSVSNHERRAKSIIDELVDSPDLEYEITERRIRKSRDLIDPKTWLREQYSNEDNQVVCQICQESMPFKYRENYYFDAVEILKGYFTKEHKAQFLALCPGCSSKYKTFVKKVPEAMNALKDNLINADNSCGFEVSIKLGDRDASIRFVERH